MDKMIEVLEKHKIQWSVTSVPYGEGGETYYTVWLVVPYVSGVWSAGGTTALEAIQNALAPMFLHTRQAGSLCTSKEQLVLLRHDLHDQEFVIESTDLAAEAPSRKLVSYAVEVCRIGYGAKTLHILAHSRTEAEALALLEAGNEVFSERSATYEIV
jgi:hypothetical protein